FFSSRRRHTRSKRDWSSDVCSSDLFLHHIDNQIIRAVVDTDYLSLIYIIARFNQKDSAVLQTFQRITGYLTLFQSDKRTAGAARSEERRVGKECGCRCGQVECKGQG